MKLRNKKTGEIKEIQEVLLLKHIKNDGLWEDGKYNSLAELNAEWEDCEEPKDHWYIYGAEPFEVDDGNWNKEFINELKVIGNYFETKEDAELAVRKLKAWKRLKDRWFRFLGYYHRLGETKSKGEIGFEMDDYEGTKQDLDLLFGGEE